MFQNFFARVYTFSVAVTPLAITSKFPHPRILVSFAIPGACSHHEGSGQFMQTDETGSDTPGQDISGTQLISKLKDANPGKK